MNDRTTLTIVIMTGMLVILGGWAVSAQDKQDKYTLKVPNGLAFGEFKGYEAWQVVSVSQDGPLMAAILANPVMIDAYKAGIPANGQPFPEGEVGEGPLDPAKDGDVSGRDRTGNPA